MFIFQLRDVLSIIVGIPTNNVARGMRIHVRSVPATHPIGTIAGLFGHTPVAAISIGITTVNDAFRITVVAELVITGILIPVFKIPIVGLVVQMSIGIPLCNVV